MIISSLPSSSSSSLITPRSSPFLFSSLRHLLTLATFLLSSSFLPLHLSILPYLYLLLLPPILSLQPFLLLSFSYYLYLPPSYLPSFLHFFPYRPPPFSLSTFSIYFYHFFFFPPPSLPLPFFLSTFSFFLAPISSLFNSAFPSATSFSSFPPPSPFLFFKFLFYFTPFLSCNFSTALYLFL